MSFLRDIWSDLVEKRLWPVAVLLVVAMVAAPVVLAGGSSEPAAEPPAAAAPAPEAPATAKASAAGVGGEPVSLDQAPSQPRPKGGYKDPFAGGVKAAKASDPPPTGSTPAPAADKAPSTSSGGDKGGDTTPVTEPVTPSTTPVTTVPDTTPDTTPSTPTPTGVFAGYRVDVHWGRAGAAKRMRDLVRLRRLDAGDEPLLVYLGVRREGNRALFLVATDAAAVGDGRCMPAENACQVVEMRAGESHFFDVEDTDGSIEQYELDVDRIVKRYADTGAAAKEQRGETSKLGRKLLNETVESGRDYVTAFEYLGKLGVVVRDVKATTSWFRQATYAEVGKTSGE